MSLSFDGPSELPITGSRVWDLGSSFLVPKSMIPELVVHNFISPRLAGALIATYVLNLNEGYVRAIERDGMHILPEEELLPRNPEIRRII